MFYWTHKQACTILSRLVVWIGKIKQTGFSGLCQWSINEVKNICFNQLLPEWNMLHRWESCRSSVTFPKLCIFAAPAKQKWELLFYFLYLYGHQRKDQVLLFVLLPKCHAVPILKCLKYSERKAWQQTYWVPWWDTPFGLLSGVVDHIGKGHFLPI